MNLLLACLLFQPLGAETRPETKILHAGTATVWVHALRDSDSGALLSATLEARFSAPALGATALAITDSAGDPVIEFPLAAMRAGRARLSLEAESEALTTVSTLLADPALYQLSVSGERRPLEPAETSVAVGSLSASGVVSGASAVTAIRSPSGGALLITVSLRSPGQGLEANSIALYQGAIAGPGAALVRVTNFSISVLGGPAHFTSYVPISADDATGRAALDGLFADPSGYTIGIHIPARGAELAFPLAATEVHRFRARMSAAEPSGKLGTAESLDRIAVYVSPTAAHLTFQSHLRLPEAREVFDYGLVANSGFLPFVCTADLTLDPLRSIPLAASTTLYAHCNVFDASLIQSLLARPAEFALALLSFSAAPVPGERSERLQGILEKEP